MSSRNKKRRKNQATGDSAVTVSEDSADAISTADKQAEDSLWSWRWALLAFAVPTAIVLLLNGLTSLSYLTWHKGISDYFYDANPAVNSFIHGNFSFWRNNGLTPDMMPLTVILRGLVLEPIVHIASLGWHSRYIIGAALLVGLSVSFLSYSFDQILSLRDRSSRWKLVVVVALLTIVYPLAAMALFYGHPEEIFGAALLLTSVVLLNKGQEEVAAGQDGKWQWLWPAVLIGLTMSVKQDFWVAAPALLLICPVKWRWSMVGTVFLTVLIFSIPEFVTSTTPLVGNLSSSSGVGLGGVAAARPTPWLLFSGPSLNFANSYNRFFIVFVALALPLLVYLRNRKLSLSQALLLVGAVMLLRAFLDVAVNDYYHLGALVCFLGAELCYIREHRTVTLHKLRPYRIPLPWATLIWGVIIWQLTTFNGNYDVLIKHLSTTQEYIFPLLYTIACLVPLVVCLRVLCWPDSTRPVWSLRYWIVFPTVLLTALVCSLTAFGSQPQPSSRPLTPAGFYTNLPAIVAIAEHEPVYWLGNDPLEITIPLPNSNPNVLAFIAYSFKNELNGEKPAKPGVSPQVSVATEKTVASGLTALISNCREQSASCSTNDTFVQTPIGPAVLIPEPNPNGWSLYILSPSHGTVWVNGVNVPSTTSSISFITKLLSRATPELLKKQEGH